MSQHFMPAGRILGYRKNGAPIRQIAGGRSVPQREQAEQIKGQIFAIRDAAIDEKRDLSDGELGQVLDLKSRFDALDAEAARIEKAQSAIDELAKPTALDAQKGFVDELDAPQTYGESFVKSREFQ